MPWTLYRYILRELLKLLVLTTAVLVIVISFAAAIKPMSEGMLSASSMAKYLVYTAPTMLGFALPFAGAFASTLVFIRMAADNEILACSASGMSYRTILMPVLVLGVALTMGLFYLSNFVIPRFYRAAAQTVESDLMDVLVSQLNQNRPFVFDDLVLYADRAAEGQPTPEMIAQLDSPIPPSKWVHLEGVAVGELDEEGHLRSHTTAQRASLLLFRDQDQSWVTIRAHDAQFYDPAQGSFREGFYELYDSPPVRLPSPFRDSPKFLSWPQLRQLGQQPDRYDQVRQFKRNLARALAAERLRQLIRASLEPRSPTAGQVTLQGVRPDDRYILTAPVVRGEQGALLLESRQGKPVVVTYHSPHQPQRRYEAARARVEFRQTASDRVPTALVMLEQVKVYDPRLPTQYAERDKSALPRMIWPEPVLSQDPAVLSSKELMALADAPMFERSRAVGIAVRMLYSEIAELARKIVAQLHERAATAVSCLLLTLLGAVLSMQLRGQMPLVVYFWSFLLAILVILLIHAGQNMATNTRFPLYAGLGVLWIGNVMLATIVGWFYCRLARH